MRAFRWLLLVPASAAVFYGVIAAALATHYLVEQHLCPSGDLTSGICDNRTMGLGLKVILHTCAALSGIVVSVVSATVAPSHKEPALWAALALLFLAMGYFGYAGNAWSLFLAVLMGGALGAAAIHRFLLRRTPDNTPPPGQP
jgi:hypothetical protein